MTSLSLVMYVEVVLGIIGLGIFVLDNVGVVVIVAAFDLRSSMFIDDDDDDDDDDDNNDDDDDNNDDDDDVSGGADCTLGFAGNTSTSTSLITVTTFPAVTLVEALSALVLGIVTTSIELVAGFDIIVGVAAVTVAVAVISELVVLTELPSLPPLLPVVMLVSITFADCPKSNPVPVPEPSRVREIPSNARTMRCTSSSSTSRCNTSR